MAIATGQITINNINEGIQVNFSTNSYTFAGAETNALAGSVEITVSALVGKVLTACTVGTITGLPEGMSAPVTSDNTTAPKITVSVTTSMVTGAGVLSIPVTVNGVQLYKSFTYAIAFKGGTGASAYAVQLSNDSISIPTDAEGNNPVLTGASTTISVFEGATSRTPVLGTLVTLGCTASKAGAVVTITSINADLGYVDIPVSYDSINLGTKRFNFAKVRKGEATPKLTLEIPDGNVFKGNSGAPKNLNVRLFLGETDVTGLSTIKWYFNGTENLALAGLTAMQVYPADVAGNLTVKVTATYDGITYQDAVTFLDVDDVYQVSVSGKDKIKNSSENVVLTASAFRGSTQITEGFRCRWTDIGAIPPVVIYEGINTTGTLAERGVTITLTPAQINDKLDILCELSVDTVEQALELTEENYVPNYDSKAYAAAMSVALA